MNLSNDERRVALITGTSSGFGLLASVALAKEGFYVIASMRNLEKKGHLLEAAQKEQVEDRIEYVQLDVERHDQIEEVVQNVVKRFGTIDLLLNNAGYAEGGFVEDLTIDDWRRQFDTNFFGMIAVTKAVLPYMREQRRGTIMNLSSISGRIGYPSMGPYVASKFAMEGFSETLRLEMLPFGVHVVLIEPGSYKTEIWSKGLETAKIVPGSPYEKLMRVLLREINKIADTAGDPKEVVDLIVRAAKSPYPKLRYPIGKGVKSGIILKSLLPWKWIEQKITERLKKYSSM